MIQDLINNAISNREGLRQTYEYRKNLISTWNRRVKAIRDTYMSVDRTLWEEMISASDQTKTWDKIKAIIEGTDTSKGLLNNLKELGDGNQPGVFTTAYHRVTRKHINIGVVGAYRQGKSTLLKQLIKPKSPQLMPRDIIPTIKGGDPCTGTSVNYINCANDVPGTILKSYPLLKNDLPTSADDVPRAVVVFNTVREMCVIINKYIEECGFNGWGTIDLKNEPVSRARFEEYCCTNKDKALAISNAQANTMAATFRNIILEYKKYLDLLGHDDELIDNLGESTNRELFYKRSTFYYEGLVNNFSVYAVKKVDVYLDFKVADEEVGPIQFLDTPGVGEKRVGVDETLREKLINEIDTVIAIEKAHGEAPPTEALNSFHSSLTENYGGKQSGFIYYIINDATDGDIRLVGQAYCRAFTNGIEKTVSPVILPPNRKQIVDCESNIVYDYDLYSDGTIKSLHRNNENCQSLLYTIINNLATNIEIIDRDFISSSDKLYNVVSRQMVQLNGLTSGVQISIDNNNVAVNNTVDRLCHSLSRVKNHSIVDTVVIDIQEYAKSEDVGKEVLYSLQKEHKEELNEEVIESIISAVRDCKDTQKAHTFAALTLETIGRNSPCTSHEYGTWMEFRTYSYTKSILFEIITDKVRRLVSAEPILARLQQAQKELYDIFRCDDFLGFIAGKNESDTVWFDKLMDSISDSSWKDSFNAFFLFDVEGVVQDFIKREVIDEIIRKYMHNDNFNDALFNTLENANISFLQSLWKIENIIKKSLRNENESILEALKNSVNKDFRTRRDDAINFDRAAPNNMNNQIVYFISVHYNEILKRLGVLDQQQRKAALYRQWQEINREN